MLSPTFQNVSWIMWCTCPCKPGMHPKLLGQWTGCNLQAWSHETLVYLPLVYQRNGPDVAAQHAKLVTRSPLDIEGLFHG